MDGFIEDYVAYELFEEGQPNLTHERRETRSKPTLYRGPRHCGKQNDYGVNCLLPNHLAQHGDRIAVNQMDPCLVEVFDNPLRNNLGTILKHYRACRTVQKR